MIGDLATWAPVEESAEAIIPAYAQACNRGRIGDRLG
jgi:hypothetical protein